ncbi:MAG: hypothetical protein M1470_14835 [Bacteroidetes bacterium]|nr:hypothetical protein [Bacteroidota bacterium]MCL5737945.1 hypothetical protein [Bacteroidota bacterium]
MKQHDAVIEVMKANGGYAALGHLYAEVLKIPGVEWNTKTPFASIRRIVQDGRFFFKIRPGLWALKEFQNKLPESIFPHSKTPSKTRESYTHSYYQGLLIEIGNFKLYQTFVPAQDKNKIFLNGKLGELTKLSKIYRFTYDHLIEKAQTIDVVWFNERNLPSAFFEVEHSSDIQNSLLKYVELQDFNVDFRIVADRARRREFEAKITLSAFRPIAPRVKFIDYDTVSELHSKTSELRLIEEGWR